MTRGVPVAQAAAFSEPTIKFRKCKNEGCQILVGFERKDDGGWRCVERDVLNQIVPHSCKGKRPVPQAQPQQQPKQPQPDLHYLAGQLSAQSEELAYIREEISSLKSIILRFETEFLEGRVA